jgi:hypothetical protein
MPTAGQLTGRYNIVVKDEYDLFDHRVPVEEYVELLREDSVPEELCVVGLEDAFNDDETIETLSRQMEKRADALEGKNQLPTIQFAVEGGFQRRKSDFELQTEDDLYRLSRVFGPQLERKRSGWLIAPF